MNKNNPTTGFRNENLFCFNCGASFDIQLPQPVSFAADLMKLFDKHHKNCQKTWQQPEVDQSMTETQKAYWWFDKKNGEHGMSSMAIYTVLINNGVYAKHLIEDTRKGFPHPHDPDDFRRCYLLLKTVPEWKDKLHLMKQVSPVWSNIIDNWDKLCTMLEQQMQSSKDEGMNDFMKTLGC
jgi:hypothetical protein